MDQDSDDLDPRLSTLIEPVLVHGSLLLTHRSALLRDTESQQSRPHIQIARDLRSTSTCSLCGACAALQTSLWMAQVIASIDGN